MSERHHKRRSSADDDQTAAQAAQKFFARPSRTSTPAVDASQLDLEVVTRAWDVGEDSTGGVTDAREARAHNDRFPDLVEEFNRLTQHSCTRDGRELDVELLARWQTDHGLSPADGKIRPIDVETARESALGPAAVRHTTTVSKETVLRPEESFRDDGKNTEEEAGGR